LMMLLSLIMEAPLRVIALRNNASNCLSSKENNRLC
jgi:hypothetical protein